MNRLIPATTDSKIAAFRNNVLKTRVRDASQDFCRPVGGVIVDHNDIEFKVTILVERTPDGFENRLFTILYRYDNAGFYRKCFCRGSDLLKIGFKPSADPPKMRCGDLLHFDLE